MNFNVCDLYHDTTRRGMRRTAVLLMLAYVGSRFVLEVVLQRNATA